MKKDIEIGLKQLRTKWPQTHAVPSDTEAWLITVPTVKLPAVFKENVCTVLFVAPAGFPFAVPKDFYTDIEISLASVPWEHVPVGTVRYSPEFTYEMYGREWKGGGSIFKPWDRYWPQWDHVMGWKLRVAAWNPNHDSLYTYMMLVKMGLENYYRRPGGMYSGVWERSPQ